MRVLVDVDGVVADFAGGWLDAFEAATGRRHTKDEITTWEFRQSIPMLPWEEAAAEYELARRLDFKEIPGAVDAVRELLIDKHQVAFVTAPHTKIKEWSWARAKWLDDRFPGIPIISTRHKEWISGDVLIDDRVSNLVEWRGTNPKGLAILFNQPWNLEHPIGTEISRYSDWADILQRIGLREISHIGQELDRIAYMRAP